MSPLLPGSTGRRGYHHKSAISPHDVQLVLHVVHIKVVLTGMIEGGTKIGQIQVPRSKRDRKKLQVQWPMVNWDRTS